MKLTKADNAYGCVFWTPSQTHALCRIGRRAWQVRERRADGSPFGDLLNVLPTKKAAVEYVKTLS